MIKVNVSSHIKSIKPYEGGLPIEEVARELNIPEQDIVKLASNENPLGISPFAKKAIEKSLIDIERYPDGNGFYLKRAISKKYKLQSSEIILGNGSNDVLELVARPFLSKNDEAIYSEHAFAVYPLVVKAVGAEGIEVRAKNFSHDLDAMLDSIKSNTKIIFIANPNNPTGSFIGRAEILKFLDKVPEDIIVLLDQAYFDYSSFEDSDVDFDILNNFPNLVMSRSFSKAYGLAGFRIGYSVSSEDIANYLNRVRQPFNANSLALFAAEQAIEDEEFMNKCLQLNLEQKKVLYKGLESLGFHCLPSKGNFISFDCKEDSTGLFNRLLSQGVIVRTLGVYKMPNFLRVSVGLPEENLIFLEKLQLTMS